MSLFDRPEKDSDLDDEIRFHLNMAAKDRIQNGQTVPDARNSALCWLSAGAMGDAEPPGAAAAGAMPSRTPPASTAAPRNAKDLLTESSPTE